MILESYISLMLLHSKLPLVRAFIEELLTLFPLELFVGHLATVTILASDARQIGSINK